MAFEPFAMATTANVVEQTPLTSLVGLPAMGEAMGEMRGREGGSVSGGGGRASVSKRRCRAR